MSQTISGYHTTPITLASGGAYASPTTLTGTLKAFGGYGLVIESPWNLTVTGELENPFQSGTLVEALGKLNLDNTGIISGGGAGIALHAGGAVTQTTTGLIEGNYYGINAYAAGQPPAIPAIYFSINNAGTIIGADEIGIFGGLGSVTNSGIIKGEDFGILDVTNIQNSGYIRGRSYVGVALNAGGTLNNTADATIIGGLFGVYASTETMSAITNSGYILGGQSAGINIGQGSIHNAGTVYGGNAGIDLSHPASLTNTGLIASEDFGGFGVSAAQRGFVTNSGTITGYTGIALNGGILTNIGLIQGETHSNDVGRDVPSAAGIAVNFTAPGTFIENGGIVLGSIVGDSGTLILDSGTLSEISGFSTDSFAGPATLATSLSGLGTIAGFSPTDKLILTDQTATSGIFLNHALTLSNGAIIDFAGTYAAHQFHVTADPNGGTSIDTACFCPGTRIATPSGEVPVEDLRIGDLVLTRHAGPQPIRWIGMRAYADPFANLPDIRPIRIAAGALSPGIPARDLFVSPGHAIFTRGRLIHAARLVNGATITQLPYVREVRYFHLELPAHDIIFAESCPAESLHGFRHLFHNAPPDTPQPPALPRCLEGFPLHRGHFAAGPIRSFLDDSGPIISGWAQHVFAPETPVVLDLLASGRRLARILANQYRPELRAAGLGSGHHGFSLPRPAWLESLDVKVTLRPSHPVMPAQAGIQDFLKTG